MDDLTKLIKQLQTPQEFEVTYAKPQRMGLATLNVMTDSEESAIKAVTLHVGYTPDYITAKKRG